MMIDANIRDNVKFIIFNIIKKMTKNELDLLFVKETKHI